ncbi:MAG: TRAP transporter substrate-binding protein [Alphaproteobacteria bacterium]|nr:TRAP transporter substrate-binding protein [Alphaproteobacteria bacterium]
MTRSLTRRQFGKAAAAGVAIITTAGLSRPAKAKVTIKFSNAANERYVGNRFATAFFEKVKERTGGEVQAEMFFGTLGGEKTLLDGVGLGTLDAYNGAYTGTREYDILYSAFLFRDYAHAKAVVTGPLKGALEKLIAEKYQGQLMGLGRAGAFALYTKDKVASWAGLKDMKIRAGQIEGVISGLKAFGANPTPIPFNEVYSALQQGVVNAQVTLSSLVISQKYYEVTKYSLRPDFGLGLDKFVIAQSVWKKLTPQQQEILRATFAELEESVWFKTVSDEAGQIIEQWKGFNGADSVVQLSEADGRKVMDPVNQKLMDEVFGAGTFDKVQKA